MSSTEYATVEIGSIIVSGANPRKTFDDDALRELAGSIREHGILEPLVLSTIMDEYRTDHKALIGRVYDLGKPSEHVVVVPAVLAEEEEEEEEEAEVVARTRLWRCSEDDDAIEAKDLDEAMTKVGCIGCDLLQDPLEGCEGPEEVSR